MKIVSYKAFVDLAVSSVEEQATISKVEVLLFVSVAPVGRTIFVSLVDIAEDVVALEKSVSFLKLRCCYLCL